MTPSLTCDPLSPRSLILSHTFSAISSENIRSVCVRVCACKYSEGRMVTSQLHGYQSGQTTRWKHGRFPRRSGGEQPARAPLLFQSKIQYFLLSSTVSPSLFGCSPSLSFVLCWFIEVSWITFWRSFALHLLAVHRTWLSRRGRVWAVLEGSRQSAESHERKSTRRERGRGNKRKMHWGTWINKSTLRREDRWPGSDWRRRKYKITVQIM